MAGESTINCYHDLHMQGLCCHQGEMGFLWLGHREGGGTKLSPARLASSKTSNYGYRIQA